MLKIENGVYVITSEDEAKEYIEFLNFQGELIKAVNELKNNTIKERVLSDDKGLVSEDSRSSDAKNIQEENLSCLDKIIDYANDLPYNERIGGKAIELMLLKVFGRECSEEQFYRITNITNNLESKRPAIANNFYEGSQQIGTITKQNNRYGRNSNE